MDISPSEAQEALAAIDVVAHKTRQSIAGSGAYVTLISTGIVWLGGFMATQFLPEGIIPYVWLGLSIVGGTLGTVMGLRAGRRVRSPSAAGMAKRIGLPWLLLVVYGGATIAVLWPMDGTQLTVLVAQFVMVGHMAMGLLFSFAAVWWVLPITALVLIGYFLVPGWFYLWMSLLGGGGMIALGLYIRSRW
ncbi:MAG: hypothetical protein PVH41_18190 [Anaerolineae bacterium]